MTDRTHACNRGGALAKGGAQVIRSDKKDGGALTPIPPVSSLQAYSRARAPVKRCSSRADLLTRIFWTVAW